MKETNAGDPHTEIKGDPRFRSQASTAKDPESQPQGSREFEPNTLSSQGGEGPQPGAPGGEAPPAGQNPEWEVPGQDSFPGVENTPQPPSQNQPEGPHRRWL